MKQGDIGTELVFTILDETGQAVDLTNATSATLVMQLGKTKIEKTCYFVDRLGAKVGYKVSAGDLIEPGTLYMEVRVEFLDGTKYTTNRIQEPVGVKL